MRLAGKLFQHRLGLGGVRRLSVDPAGEDDFGVDAEDGTLGDDAGNRPRLPLRPLLDFRNRIRARRLLLVLRHDRVERNAELLQDRASLG